MKKLLLILSALLPMGSTMLFGLTAKERNALIILGAAAAIGTAGLAGKAIHDRYAKPSNQGVRQNILETLPSAQHSVLPEGKDALGADNSSISRVAAEQVPRRAPASRADKFGGDPGVIVIASPEQLAAARRSVALSNLPEQVRSGQVSQQEAQLRVQRAGYQELAKKSGALVRPTPEQPRSQIRGQELLRGWN